jgi:hypothetical protein
MGIDIAELVKEARHGMFKAGLIPERLALDGPHRTRSGAARPRRPRTCADIMARHVARNIGVPMIPSTCDKAEYAGHRRAGRAG